LSCRKIVAETEDGELLHLNNRNHDTEYDDFDNHHIDHTDFKDHNEHFDHYGHTDYKSDGHAAYRIVTDRWQKMTEVELTQGLLDRLSDYCDEFLIHAVDVEGKCRGIEEDVARLLGSWGKKPVTYAGGVSSFRDLDQLRLLGKNKVDVTIGSALDIFGGHMSYRDVLAYMK
ncbi:MAG: hypothetical protein II627_07305, partial [Lachnospiraceae bacterium]|nr:hypothetical protein [Lachnospiraceae bacterium]